jgi:hypothetical protein
LLRTTERVPGFSRDAELLRYFRSQLAVLSDEKVLEIVKTFGSASFTNRQVRPLLGTTRQGAWLRLSNLVELGILEKRGNGYKVSHTAGDMISAVATAFRSLLTFKVLAENRPRAQELVVLSKQGVELMYAKGMIQPADVSRYQKMLAGIEEELNAHDG